MKVLERGRPQKGWSTEIKCTGSGNGGGGCGAKLLVEQVDLYKTYRNCRDESDTFVTFTCCECGVETDLPSETFPLNLMDKIPDKAKADRVDR
jgi:hypothetical protein